MALATAAAEYMAASDGVKEAIWLRQLLKDIGYEQEGPTSIMIDNQSAIALSKNAEFHQRSKHIDVKFHFIRDQVTNGVIIPVYTPTDEQLADVFTKPLSAQKFKENVLSFGMTDLRNN